MARVKPWVPSCQPVPRPGRVYTLQPTGQSVQVLRVRDGDGYTRGLCMKSGKTYRNHIHTKIPLQLPGATPSLSPLNHVPRGASKPLSMAATMSQAEADLCLSDKPDRRDSKRYVFLGPYPLTSLSP